MIILNLNNCLFTNHKNLRAMKHCSKNALSVHCGANKKFSTSLFQNYVLTCASLEIKACKKKENLN